MTVCLIYKHIRSCKYINCIARIIYIVYGKVNVYVIITLTSLLRCKTQYK